jgi:glutamate dehydrogenase
MLCQADAFVPAGGRPASIHLANWRDFLQPDGTPSARVIVEGANLFVTQEARQALFDHRTFLLWAWPPPTSTFPVWRQALFDEVRLPIVKDSSANKCGVICSSMEIAASMLLDEKEFLELKPACAPAPARTRATLSRRAGLRVVAG